MTKKKEKKTEITSKLNKVKSNIETIWRQW